MTRILAVVLAVVMVVSLAACGKEQTAEKACSNCGKSISQDASFCEHCGTAQNNTNKDNSSDNSSTDDDASTPTDTSEPTESSKPTTQTPTHTHSYSNATCTTPKKCSCDATEGSALGHRYSAATCTTPKTCNNCGITVGTVTNHNYNENGACAKCGAVTPEATEYITFKDAFLENYIKQSLGISGTNKVSKYAMSKLISFDIKDGISDVQDLKYATNLEKIQITNINVKNLTCLSSIKTLTKINISQNDYFDLSFMKGLSKIEEVSIDMRWSEIIGGSVSDLVSSPRLTTLIFSDPFTNNKEGLSFLERATSLSELELCVEEGTDISVVLNMPKLKTFKLRVSWVGRQPTEHENIICNELIKKGVSVKII